MDDPNEQRMLPCPAGHEDTVMSHSRNCFGPGPLITYYVLCRAADCGWQGPRHEDEKTAQRLWGDRKPTC